MILKLGELHQKGSDAHRHRVWDHTSHRNPYSFMRLDLFFSDHPSSVLPNNVFFARWGDRKNSVAPLSPLKGL